MPRDPPDEQHVGPVRIHSVVHQRVDLAHLAVGLRVDAVVHHVHNFGVHERVAVEDILTHTRTHGDDGVGVGVRGVLHPGGDGVAAAELLALPRPAGLQRVRRDHVRDVVQQARQVAPEIGVPGVGVGDVAAGDGLGHAEVHTQGL